MIVSSWGTVLVNDCIVGGHEHEASVRDLGPGLLAWVDGGASWGAVRRWAE